LQSSKPKILVAGDVIIDSYIYGSIDRMAPDFYGFVFDSLDGQDFLGGAGNVANNLAKLIPDNEINLLGSCNTQGFDDLFCYLHFIPVSSETMIKTRYIAVSDQDPHKPKNKQKLIRVDTKKKFHAGLTNIHKMYGKYDFIVISDYDKGTIADNFFYRKNNGEILIVDSKKSDLTIFDNADYIKVNAKEYKKVTSKSPHTTFIVTNGKDPVKVIQDDIVLFEVPTVTVKNPTTEDKDYSGTGDSFLAGLIYGLYHGKGIKEAIKYGNTTAALSIHSYGTTAVKEEDLLKEISTNPK